MSSGSALQTCADVWCNCWRWKGKLEWLEGGLTRQVGPRSQTCCGENRVVDTLVVALTFDVHRQVSLRVHMGWTVVLASNTLFDVRNASHFWARVNVAIVASFSRVRQALTASRTTTSARAPLTAPGKTPRSALHSSSSRLHEQRCDSVPAGLPRAQTDELTRS